MATIVQPSRFQLNSDYFPNKRIQSPKNSNIYLGGTKSPNLEKSPKLKGITLTKSFQSPQKLSNLTYLRQTQYECQSIYNLKLSNQNLFLKPNFHEILPRDTPNASQSVKKSFSSPLINKHHFLSNSLLLNCPNRHKIITNLNLLSNRPNTIIRFTPQSSPSSSISLAPRHLSQSFSQKKLLKIQYVNPAEKLTLNSSSKQKLSATSTNQKITFPTKFATGTQTLSKKLSSTNCSQKAFENNWSIYLQKEVPQHIETSIKNQTCGPIKMVSKFRPALPLTIRRESLEQKCSNLGKKEECEFQNEYESIPSLKHSKSTVGEQESPFSSYEQLQERAKQGEEKNAEWSGEKKRLKNSIKSLWDCVEKCTVSIICQGAQGNMALVGETGFKQSSHKTYNNLCQECHFDSMMIQKWEGEKREEQ